MTAPEATRLEHLRDLAERADRDADRVEAESCLPDELVADLARTGAFRRWVPPRLGGGGASLEEGLEEMELLSRRDGALGWMAMIGSTTSVLSGYLEEAVAEEIWSDPEVLVCGVTMPSGTARVDGDSLVASGRWSWGSGTRYAGWIGGGCMVDLGERKEPWFVVFERNQVVLHDDWDAAGLRGTASVTFEVNDARVPKQRHVHLGVTEPWADGAIYRVPMWGLLALGVAAVALGLGRRAIDELLAIAEGKRYASTRRTLARRATVQAEVGRCDAAMQAARALLYAAAKGPEERLGSSAAALSIEHRRRMRLAATHATRAALSTAQTMFDLAGGTAVHKKSPLQRVLRDVTVAAQHQSVALRNFELTGRILLGLKTDTTLL